MKTLEFIKEALNYVDHIDFREEGLLTKDKRMVIDLYRMSLESRNSDCEIKGDHYDHYVEIDLKENDYTLYQANIDKNEELEQNSEYIKDLEDLCRQYINTPVEER